MAFFMKLADTRKNKKLTNEKNYLINQKIALVQESFNAYEKLARDVKNPSQTEVPKIVACVEEQQGVVSTINKSGISMIPKGTVATGPSRLREMSSNHSWRSSKETQDISHSSGLDGSFSRRRKSINMIDQKQKQVYTLDQGNSNETPKAIGAKGTVLSPENHFGHRHRYAVEGKKQSSRKLLGVPNGGNFFEGDSSHRRKSGLQKDSGECHSNPTPKQVRMRNSRRNLESKGRNEGSPLRARQHTRSLSQNALPSELAFARNTGTISNHNVKLIAHQGELRSTSEHTGLSLFGRERLAFERQTRSSRSLNHSDHAMKYNQHHGVDVAPSRSASEGQTHSNRSLNYSDHVGKHQQQHGVDVAKSRAIGPSQCSFEQSAGIPSEERGQTIQQSRTQASSQLNKEQSKSHKNHKSNRDMNERQWGDRHTVPPEHLSNGKRQQSIRSLQAHSSTNRGKGIPRVTGKNSASTRSLKLHTFANKGKGTPRVTEKNSAYTRSRRNRILVASSGTPAPWTARTIRQPGTTNKTSGALRRPIPQPRPRSTTSLLRSGGKNWDDVD